MVVSLQDLRLDSTTYLSPESIQFICGPITIDTLKLHPLHTIKSQYFSIDTAIRKPLIGQEASRPCER